MKSSSSPSAMTTTPLGERHYSPLLLAGMALLVAGLMLGIAGLAQWSHKLPAVLANAAPVRAVVSFYATIKPALTLYSGPRYVSFLCVVVAVYWLLRSQQRRALFLLACGLVFALTLAHVALTMIAATLGAAAVAQIGARAAARDRRAAAVTIALIALTYGAALATPHILDLLGLALPGVRAFAGQHWILRGYFMFIPLKLIHYVWDIQKEKGQVQGWRDLLLWLFFFPSFVNAPFERFQSFVRQRANAPTMLSAPQALLGVRRIAWGALKGGLGYLVFTHVAQPALFAAPAAVEPGRLWLAAYGYSLALYLDFSGLADAMIGSAHLLGWRLSENFGRPYLQTDFRGFWRTWNVTTSSWLRDYVYIPLGGNRRHVYANLMLTMLVAGMWHNLSLNFLAWGLLHGVGLCLSRACHDWLGRASADSTLGQLRSNPRWTRAGRLTGICLTFNLVTLFWIFHHNGYQAISFQNSIAMVTRMLGLN